MLISNCVIVQRLIRIWPCFKVLKGMVAEVCVDMHDTVAKETTRFWKEVRRRYYITPSSYMELIRIYSRMLHEQKSEFMKNR